MVAVPSTKAKMTVCIDVSHVIERFDKVTFGGVGVFVEESEQPIRKKNEITKIPDNAFLIICPLSS